MSKKSSVKTPSADEPKFETAMSRLEKIVQEMESGELPLEDALKKYEEGVGLARYCSEKLSEVQKKIEVLKKDSKGNFARVAFDAPEGGEDKE